jgi:GntR family transcriptional regulator
MASVEMNRNDASPLHEQVASDLRRRMEVGELSGGDKLPSLRALAATYGVSEVTAHTAIRELQRESLVTSVPGRGTFVQQDAAARVAAAGGESGEVAALRQEVADLRQRVEAIEACADEPGVRSRRVPD